MQSFSLLAVLVTLINLGVTDITSGQATNIALTGTATQSTTRAAGGAASRAIDGNTDGVWGNGSVTHTNNGVGQWWQVTLSKLDVVHEIRIWNRSDCCDTRLTNFKVTAFLFNNHMSTTIHAGGVPAGQFLSIDLGGGVLCDRIRVQHLGTVANYLSIAELEALRYDSPVMNLARFGTAAQSSTGSGGVASRAIDGNPNRFFRGNSVTSTGNRPGDWWQVQLASLDTIDQVRIFNRGDCCGNYLSNFRFSVFSGTTEVFGKDYFPTTGSVPQGQVLVVELPTGTKGDRVRLAFKGLNRANNYIMSLAEVEVLRFGPSLTPDMIEIKDMIGATQRFKLEGGRKFGGRPYLLLGSFSIWPGITFGGITTPLNLDPYLLLTLNNPGLPHLSNSRGQLGATGRATATFQIPTGAPSLTGVSLFHGYVIAGKTMILDGASNAVLVRIK